MNLDIMVSYTMRKETSPISLSPFILFNKHTYSFLYIDSFNSYNNLMRWVLSLSSYDRRGGMKEHAQGSHLVSGKAGI